MRRLILGSFLLVPAFAAPAMAEMELSVYAGWQTSPHSRITGDTPGTGVEYDALIGWEGKSFQLPPYYGVRAMWWRSETLGFGAEFTHAKVYAPESEINPIGFDDIEFSDGHNILTFNAMRRWPGLWSGGSITPYVGGGLGVALPHVDVETLDDRETYGLQVAGPAARLVAGMKYDLSDRFAVFGEYQFTYSSNSVALHDGGSLETDIKTNALNVGLSLKF